MINFDHRGITRTAHALADIGECFLRLTLDHPAPLATLDATLPDDPETPANGGWFEAPGGWYLRLEGCSMSTSGLRTWPQGSRNSACRAG